MGHRNHTFMLSIQGATGTPHHPSCQELSHVTTPSPAGLQIPGSSPAQGKGQGAFWWIRSTAGLNHLIG